MKTTNFHLLHQVFGSQRRCGNNEVRDLLSLSEQKDIKVHVEEVRKKEIKKMETMDINYLTLILVKPR